MPAIRLQNAALPYRVTKAEILLVTTRQTRRWIIPKGWPIKGLKPANSAAREAFEEAGVSGEIGTKSLGVSAYDKSLDETGIRVPCEVRVFPLLVKRQAAHWPESEQRSVQWLEPANAASLVEEQDLKSLITVFAAQKRRRLTKSGRQAA